MNWPESEAGHPLGDGRIASDTERPESIDELRDAVTRRAGEGFALYPQGGRTALDYGEPPARPGVALDTTALTRVLDYPAADMTITVEAGITLDALAAILDREGQRLPLDAPHPDRATLGGVFATNTAGPRRFGAGRPRDLIIGVGFVTASGELVRGGGRVVKNVAGYDFPRLLTGSLGTLGVIVEMTLKVRPRPETSAIAWVGFDRPDDADAALGRLNTSRTRPIAVELLNRPAAVAIGGPVGLPEADWVLTLGFEDNADAVRWQLDALRPEVEPGRMEVVQDEPASPVWRSLADFADTGERLSLLASVRPSAVVPLVRRLDPARWSVQAHAGSGIVRAHRIDANFEASDVASVLNGLRSQAADSGGSVILSRCPTAWKEQLRVWGDPRGDWPLMESLKRALDPVAVMNPGRFVGII